jgi:hypothetical protein
VPRWDTSKLRAKGARLKTFGGRASGPEPLEALFLFAVNLFRYAHMKQPLHRSFALWQPVRDSTLLQLTGRAAMRTTCKGSKDRNLCTTQMLSGASRCAVPALLEAAWHRADHGALMHYKLQSVFPVLTLCVVCACAGTLVGASLTPWRCTTWCARWLRSWWWAVCAGEVVVCLLSTQHALAVPGAN